MQIAISDERPDRGIQSLRRRDIRIGGKVKGCLKRLPSHTQEITGDVYEVAMKDRWRAYNGRRFPGATEALEFFTREFRDIDDDQAPAKIRQAQEALANDVKRARAVINSENDADHSNDKVHDTLLGICDSAESLLTLLARADQ